MDTASYRGYLAHYATIGRLEGFLTWLTFVAGYEWSGLWHPASGLSKADCKALADRLTEAQLAELAERGLIPPLNTASDKPEPFDWQEQPHERFTTPSSAVVISVTEGVYEENEVIYQLPAGGELLLHKGELEMLAAAGYPNRWHGVFAVLWRQIAPPVDQRSAFSRLRDISAVLNAPATNLAAQLDQARTLAIWPVAADPLVAAMVLAEQAVIRAAYAAVQRGSQDSELIAAVHALQTTIANAERDGAVKEDRPLIPS